MCWFWWARWGLKNIRWLNVIKFTESIRWFGVFESASTAFRMDLFWGTICINATVGTIFIHFTDAKQERIIENVDDTFTRHNWIITEIFIPSVLIIRQFERVMRSIFNHNRAVKFGRENNFRVCRWFIFIIIVFWKVCQALCCRSTINLSIIFLLITMQEANFPPLFTRQQVGSFWHRVALCRRHNSIFTFQL